MRLLLPHSPPLRAQRAGGFAASLALHILAAVLAVLGTRAVTAGPAGTGTSGSTIVVAVAEDMLLPSDPAPEPETDVPPQSQPALALDTFEFDIDKIARRRHALFPFLTGDVLFLERMVEKTEIRPDALRNPLGHRPPSSRPPLAVDAAEIQRLVDDAWSRRDRWAKFAEIVRLLESHDPHSGQAASLVHVYLDQNLLQPYEDARTRDSKYWVMMELVSDHVDFIDFIRSYSRRYPASRTTTELLFLLDELAQGSLDSFLMLLGTHVPTELTATQFADQSAFLLAQEIGEHYRAWLLQHGLPTPAAVIARYEQLRLRILEAILASTPSGYRAGDARFLIGQILFNQNDVEGAFRAWSAIAPAADDNYAQAYLPLLDAIETPGRTPVPRVIAILAQERIRWLEFSRQRLRAFGYEFNTF